METVDLNALVEDTIPLIYNQAKIQKIIIKTVFPEKPVFIVGNDSLLQQVLINLFLNAIQVMPDGGAIRLMIGQVEDEALIQIADSGYGISKQDIDKIFDPFYTTSPVGRGTGLGLSISYSIVKQHNGVIEVESKEGNGCTFTVRLPVS
jgi:signal transduction histidine kinase